MDKTSDNVITINGTKDNLYDKAIFIIKPEKEGDTASLDFIKEADKILNNYIVKSILESQNSTNTNSNTVNKIIDNSSFKIKSAKKTINTKTKHKYTSRADEVIDKLLAFSIISCSLLVMYILNTM